MGLLNLFKGRASDEISFEELAAALAAGAVRLIDVREPAEFAAGHVEGARNMPLSRFDPATLPADRPLALICRSGGRSAQALARARACGRSDARHYRGGVVGWARRGGRLV